MSADVVLLLEGTYPYVRGGVSSWVHQIIQGMPHLTFHLVFVGGDPEFYGEQKYELPDNVVGLDTHYIMDESYTKARASKGNASAYDKWKRFETYFHDTQEAVPTELLREMFSLLGDDRGIPVQDFMHSKEGWRALVKSYRTYCPDFPFTDFFWAYRNLYLPLLKSAIIARSLPKARLYHSISTGYAGFLGAGANALHGTPLLISEHGIYTKERKIDLAQANWIAGDDQLVEEGLAVNMGYIRRMWIRFFEQLGLSGYHAAAKITALYAGNQRRQLKDGADAQKTLVVPNGINIERYSDALASRGKEIPKVAGLVGRVVSIKDIKTFIRALRHACGTDPQIKGLIIGPYDEDPGYYEECRQLVDTLGLADKVTFMGMQNVAEILPQLGVMVLTSISEAQPLVLLEGMAAGVPFVATDVGSCREIAEGMTDADQQLGQAGTVVPIASPQKTADAIVELLNDQDKWHAMQHAGLARVKAIYDEKMMYESYKQLYSEVMAWPE